MCSRNANGFFGRRCYRNCWFVSYPNVTIASKLSNSSGNVSINRSCRQETSCQVLCCMIPFIHQWDIDHGSLFVLAIGWPFSIPRALRVPLCQSITRKMVADFSRTNVARPCFRWLENLDKPDLLKLGV